MHTHIPYIAVSAFDIVAMVAVIGVLGCRLWVIPATAIAALHPRLWRLLAIALGALTVSSLVLFVGRTVEMSREPLAMVGPILPMVARDTAFGQIWLIRPVVLLLLWLGWFIGRRQPAWGVATAAVMMALAAVIAFTRSATGHPADQGQFTAPEWVDWIHLLAVAIWAGTLFTMVFAIFPSLRRTHADPSLIAVLIGRLSRLAALALAVALITGVLSAYHYLVHWDNLWLSAYGRTLLLKLAFVAGAVALGALNRYRYLPRIRRWAQGRPLAAGAPPTGPVAALVWSIRIEAVLLLGALCMAAALLHGMPPRDIPPALQSTMSAHN
ncbi:MAG: copper resistance D family protein [Acidiferrobacter sp.]